jgi:hypothetical protein
MPGDLPQLPHRRQRKPSGRLFLQIVLVKPLISLFPANGIRQIAPNPAKHPFGDFVGFQGLRIWSAKFSGPAPPWGRAPLSLQRPGGGQGGRDARGRVNGFAGEASV